MLEILFAYGSVYHDVENLDKARSNTSWLYIQANADRHQHN